MKTYQLKPINCRPKDHPSVCMTESYKRLHVAFCQKISRRCSQKLHQGLTSGNMCEIIWNWKPCCFLKRNVQFVNGECNGGAFTVIIFWLFKKKLCSSSVNCTVQKKTYGGSLCMCVSLRLGLGCCWVFDAAKAAPSSHYQPLLSGK